MNEKLELIIAFILLAFSGIMFFESYNPSYRGFGQPEFPPMRFPRWLLIGIASLAGLHLLRSAMGKGLSERNFGTILWSRVVFVSTSLLTGILLFQPIGFTFASAVSFFLVAIGLGYSRYGWLALYTTLFVLGTWAVFTFAIKIGLPTSPVFHRI